MTDQLNIKPHMLRLAEAAAELNRQRGITTDDMITNMVAAVSQETVLVHRMLETLLAMQDEFPMPRSGWRMLRADIRRWIRRLERAT